MADRASRCLAAGRRLCPSAWRGVGSPPIRFLLVIDGPMGRVRSRVVISGMRTGGGKAAEPRAWTFLTLSDPKILAPLFRGKPKHSARAGRVSSRRDVASDDSEGTVAAGSVQRAVRSAPPEGGPPPITLSDGATTGGFQFLDRRRFPLGRDFVSRCVDAAADRNDQSSRAWRDRDPCTWGRHGPDSRRDRPTAQRRVHGTGNDLAFGRSRCGLVAAGDESVQWHR